MLLGFGQPLYRFNMFRYIGKTGDKAAARDRVTANFYHPAIRAHTLKHVGGTLLHMGNALFHMLIGSTRAAQATLSIKAHYIGNWPPYPHHGFRIIKHFKIGFIPGDQFQLAVDNTYALTKVFEG